MSTLWLLPGSINPVINVVPSLARRETHDGSEATSSTCMDPAAAGAEGFDTAGAGAEVADATGAGAAFAGGAGVVTGAACTGSDAEVT
jgi:hypothetical protein